jgi:putative PIG3 family NAD(P)H quinone oxidoreductase
VVYRGRGGNDVVHLEERDDPEPGEDDVRIRVRFAGMNPADVAQRNGHYPAPPGSPPDIPGLEVAGTVDAVGSRVSRWKVGDRVLGLVGGGGLADRVVAHERLLAPIPDGLDERLAAAVPEAYVTAHDAICIQGGLRLGHTLLVHGAAGGVGTASVQIGLATGCRVYGVVRSDRTADHVQGLGATPIRDRHFADELLEATAGHGADVIIELVGAPHFPANLEAVAEAGCIVIVGTGAGTKADIPFRHLMAKRAMVRGTMLRGRAIELKARAVRLFEQQVLPQLADGRFVPCIDSTYPVERVTHALDRMEESGKLGKVLLDLES